jgi:hypothetical protein
MHFMAEFCIFISEIDRWCETKQNSVKNCMKIEQNRENAPLNSPLSLRYLGVVYSDDIHEM